MRNLKHLIKKALKVSVFYYYDADIERWVVDFTFYMPRNEMVTAEELEIRKFFKHERSAINKATELAYQLDGSFEGRILDMEI